MRSLRRYRCCCCHAVADADCSAIVAASIVADRSTHAAILDGAGDAAAAANVANAGYSWSAAAGRRQCTVVGGEQRVAADDATPGAAAGVAGRLWAGRTWMMLAAADGAAADVPPR